jgi:hypothetical protein
MLKLFCFNIAMLLDFTGAFVLRQSTSFPGLMSLREPESLHVLCTDVACERVFLSSFGQQACMSYTPFSVLYAKVIPISDSDVAYHNSCVQIGYLFELSVG